MDWAGHRHAAKASPYRLNIVESTCKPDNFSTTTNRETEFGQRELFTTYSAYREQRDKLECIPASITIICE